MGLGSAAWKFGSRRETYLGLPPGHFIPADQRRRDLFLADRSAKFSPSYLPTSTNATTGTNTQNWS